MYKFFGDFGSVEDIENMWAGVGSLSEATVIAAIYDTGDYSGDAMVVYRKEGKLYEVHCSHCSCNGLDSWRPEETTYEVLMDRLNKTEDYNAERFGEEFTSALKRGLLDEMFDREVLEN
jgi:hypothetical protein